MSGYQQDQLRGQQIGLGKLIVYLRASQSLLGSFYTGLSLEAGNVWQTGQGAAFNDLLMAGSVLIGYDTPLALSKWASGPLKETYHTLLISWEGVSTRGTLTGA